MKTRFRGQSVRLRLGRSEVAAVGRGEAVEDVTTLTPSRRFAIVLRPGGETIGVAFDDGELIVRVPARRLRDWAESDAVGLSVDVNAGDAPPLRLLIEKDFVCLDSADAEDNADAFPNPAAACISSEHA